MSFLADTGCIVDAILPQNNFISLFVESQFNPKCLGESAGILAQVYSALIGDLILSLKAM